MNMINQKNKYSLIQGDTYDVINFLKDKKN